MRIAVPQFNRSSALVRDMLAKARTAPTLAEAAHWQRLALKGGK